MKADCMWSMRGSGGGRNGQNTTHDILLWVVFCYAALARDLLFFDGFELREATVPAVAPVFIVAPVVALTAAASPRFDVVRRHPGATPRTTRRFVLSAVIDGDL